MKMRGRKAVAFLSTYIAIGAAFVFVCLKAPDQVGITWPWFVMGTLVNSAGFISFTVLKDWIKSKYFRKELSNENND